MWRAIVRLARASSHSGGKAAAWFDKSSSVYSLIASTVTVYAGGDFSTIGGAPQPYLAPLDAITGLLE